MRIRRFRSFAKINLGLEVVGRLPNQYHELKTLFAAVSLHDIVEISARQEGIRVWCDHPDVPGDKTNLAYRAALIMQQLSGRTTGVEIRIRKRIPVGGGLGGGSSNAATVLRALDRMWRTGLGPQGLLPSARALGADVPYFLVGGPALGRGRGDEVTEVGPLPVKTALLVPGPGGVSTAAVFRRFADLGGTKSGRSPIEAFLESRIASGDQKPRALGTLRNDLERAALAENPALVRTARLVRRIGRATGAVHQAMSGSGSSFFLLFDESTRARRASADLRAHGTKALRCSVLSRRSYENRFEISFETGRPPRP